MWIVCELPPDEITAVPAAVDVVNAYSVAAEAEAVVEVAEPVALVASPLVNVELVITFTPPVVLVRAV
jgi:hypothetical protein